MATPKKIKTPPQLIPLKKPKPEKKKNPKVSRIVTPAIIDPDSVTDEVTVASPLVPESPVLPPAPDAPTQEDPQAVRIEFLMDTILNNPDMVIRSLVAAASAHQIKNYFPYLTSLEDAHYFLTGRRPG